MWAIFLLGGNTPRWANQTFFCVCGLYFFQVVTLLFKGQQILGLYALLDPNNLHLHSPSFLSQFTPCTDNSFEPANKRSIKLTLLPLPPLCLAVINICLEGLFSVPLLTYGRNQAINQKQIGLNNLFYSQTELLLENSCQNNVRRAQHNNNKPLRRRKGALFV